MVWKVQNAAVKAKRQHLSRLYFRVAISILSIFYDSSSRNIALKFNLFIKNNHIVLLPLFGRSEMVVNVDFWDIRALKPLPKFRS